MNKKNILLPRLTAVFLLLITISSLIYLSQHAPVRADEIGNLTIRTQETTHLVISGTQFQCTDLDNDERTISCSFIFEGSQLAMQLNTTQGKGSTITSCETTFGEQAISCRGSYSMRYRGPIVIVEDTVGISEARFKALRRIHWLDQMNEATWLRISFSFALLILLNTAVLLWQWLKKRQMKPIWHTGITLVSSLSIFFVFFLSSTIVLLFQGWID